MTALERMALISNATSENIHEVKDKIIFDQSDTGLNTILQEDGTPMARLDIREYLRRRMQEEGVTHYKMAKFLGKYQGNFTNFINGKTTISVEAVERMLWVLDGKAWGEDDEDNTRIIKQ